MEKVNPTNVTISRVIMEKRPEEDKAKHKNGVKGNEKRIAEIVFVFFWNKILYSSL